MGFLPESDAGGVATLTLDTPLFDAIDGMTLFAEIAGAGNNDELYVTGDAWLGGVLDVDLLGYTPVANDVFQVVDVDGTLTGQFDSVNLPALSYGLSWDVIYDTHGVYLAVVDGSGGGGEVPTADGDTYTVAHNGDLDTQTVLVLAPATSASVMDNDSDPNNDPLTAHVVSGPAAGSVFNFDNATGHFTYTPPVGFVGTDYFTYFVTDGTNVSNTATVTIEVTNTSPTAVDDVYTVLMDTQLVVDDAENEGVLANDVDDDTDGLEAIVVDDVDYGILEFESDGTFTYTPNVGFVGTDYFTYVASDGYDQSLAVVTIHVDSGVPVAVDDIFSTPHDAPLTIAAVGVLGNDTGIGPFTATLDAYNGSGSLNLSSDGSFTYTPPAGFIGDDSFTYYTTGPHGSSAPATVTIHVTNDIPDADEDVYVTDEDATVYGNVLDNDDDLDDLEAVLGDDHVEHGTLILNNDGSFSYEPDLDFYGVDTFSYYATDQFANSTPVVVTITVVGADQAPEFSTGSYNLNVDEVATTGTTIGTVVATDPQSQNITYSLADDIGGLFAINPTTGAISLQGTLDFEDVPSYNLTAVATDTQSNSTAASVIISVNDISETTGPPPPTHPSVGYAYYPDTSRTIEWYEPVLPLGESYTYNMQLYNVEQGVQVADIFDLTGSSYEFHNLHGGYNYSWYIRTSNSEGVFGNWDGPNYFQIDVPNAPDVQGPDAATPDATPLIRWFSQHSHSLEFSHQLQVYDVTLGQQKVDLTGLTLNQWNMSQALPAGHQYSIYLRTLNSLSDAGDWSDPYYFDIVAPAAPTVYAPATGTDTTPSIYWTAAEGANHYEVLVYSTTTGQPVLNDNTVGNEYWYDVTTPLGYDNYQVFSRAFNDYGDPGAWSDPYYFTIAQALTAAGPEADGDFPALQDAELAGIVDQAIVEWETIITDARTRALINNVTVDIVDLPENVLGMAIWNGILIDEDAAGYGWFVDPTPSVNGEFQFDASTKQFEAINNGPATGRMDLFTIVLHELGHIAGLEDIDPSESMNDLMSETIDTGIRRLPTEEHRLRYEAVKNRKRPIVKQPVDVPAAAASRWAYHQRHSTSKLIDEVDYFKSLPPAERQYAEPTTIDRIFAAIKLERELSPFG